MQRWTPTDMPAQQGRIALVTGTGGLGYETALALARAGATVIVLGRNPARGADAVRRIQHAVPQADVAFHPLDLASLDDIADCGARLCASLDRVDVLVNNAGVMTPPTRRTTADGFELQLGTNHLGHFALTAHVLPLMRRSAAPRVVTVSSIAARQGRFDFDDLQSERDYRPMVAYAQSKLACLVFARELQRHSDAGQWGLRSVAAHPGVARTDLLLNGAGIDSGAGRARRWLWFLFQPAAHGAWPSLFAATAQAAEPGGYYGPARLSETRGAPAPARVPAPARDEADAQRLWTLSTSLTGAPWPAVARPQARGADFATVRPRPAAAP
ncbi:short-chain dehydrogenase [Xanthomonas sp. Mitacek01]|nr:short-chain dehydrogenase [Xanthomonas sp. Mitacek01]